jgi:isobutyryl-CoA mutase
MQKHTGEHPSSASTSTKPHDELAPEHIEPTRSPEEEKQGQHAGLAAFHRRHAHKAVAMRKLRQKAATANGTVFAVLMDAERYDAPRQITHALLETGGQHERST